ncbi:MAG: winged helix-turn-helix transcriptional regulator [Desulfarculus sp.]|nr:winged helix-turn-helix transcriptional regulator [Desulfarculus sp.]
MASQEQNPLSPCLPGAGLPPVDQASCLEMTRRCADFNLRRATRLVSQAFDRALKPTGLKITQFSLLVAAYMNQNLILHKLARVMGMDRTTLSRNLAILEKKGLVNLERGDDRREVIARLTPQGLKALETATPLWHQTQERITAKLGDQRWEQVLGDLRALVKGLK